MRNRHGFTLLELMAAIALFSLTVTLTLESITNSADQALRAANARTLNYLAEYKIGELAYMEKETFAATEGDGGFDEELGDEYEGWEYSWKTRVLAVFGTVDQGSKIVDGYYWDEDRKEAEETSNDGTRETTGPSTTPGGPAFTVLEVTLTVRAPAEDEDDGDAVTLVAILRQPN